MAQDRTDDRITCQTPSSSLRGGTDRLQGDWTISLWNDLLWHQARVRQRPPPSHPDQTSCRLMVQLQEGSRYTGHEWKDRYGKKTLFCKKKAWRAIIIALLIKTSLSLFLLGEVLRLSRAYRLKLATTQAFFQTHLGSWSSFLTETDRRERSFWAPGGRTHLKVNYVQSEIT